MSVSGCGSSPAPERCCGVRIAAIVPAWRCGRSCTWTWTRSMRRWSSVTIQSCAASRWLWPGAGSDQWCARLRMRRGGSGCDRRCPRCGRSGLCPEAIFIPPDFVRYRAVSRQTREIFRRYTELIEPLSLDEAYLDVTTNKAGLPTATKVAIAIRQDDSGGAATDGVSGGCAEQVPGEDRIGLAEAGRTVRDPAGRGGCVSAAAAGGAACQASAR